MLHKKLLFVLLLLTPLFLAADAPNKARPTLVHIDSRPDAAEVWVDGKFVGSTPLPYHLAPGDHKIELVRARYASWTRTLTVMPDQATHVSALMEEKTERPCQ